MLGYKAVRRWSTAEAEGTSLLQERTGAPDTLRALNTSAVFSKSKVTGLGLEILGGRGNGAQKQ